MPDLRYDSDRLRDGGDRTRAAAEAAGRAAARLGGTATGASPFGRVAAADALHAAVGTAREHHARRTRDCAAALLERAARARATAGLGEDNAAATAAVACSVAAGM